MLDQLLELGKKQFGGQLSGLGLNNTQVDKTMDVAKDSVVGGLKDQLLSGNVSGVLDLFNGKSKTDTSNPIVDAIAGSFTSNMMSQVGVPEGTAKSVTGMVLPFVMEKFASKETGSANGIADLLPMLGMDKDNALSGLLGNLGGASSLLGGITKLFG